MSNGGDGERRQTEQELRLLYRAVAASSNGITISDSKLPDDPLIYVNRSFEGDAVRAARWIEEGLRRPSDLEGLGRVVTASIGIDLSTSAWEPPEEVLRRADAAMYRAKQAGKARYAVLDPSANESTAP